MPAKASRIVPRRVKEARACRRASERIRIIRSLEATLSRRRSGEGEFVFKAKVKKVVGRGVGALPDPGRDDPKSQAAMR